MRPCLWQCSCFTSGVSLYWHMRPEPSANIKTATAPEVVVSINAVSMSSRANSTAPKQGSSAQDGGDKRPLTNYSQYTADFQAALNDSRRLPTLSDCPGTHVSTHNSPQALGQERASAVKESQYYHNRRLEPVAQHNPGTNSSQHRSESKGPKA